MECLHCLGGYGKALGVIKQSETTLCFLLFVLGFFSLKKTAKNPKQSNKKNLNQSKKQLPRPNKNPKQTQKTKAKTLRSAGCTL